MDVTEDIKITAEQRKALFGRAFYVYGKDRGAEEIKAMMEKEGITHTEDMTVKQFDDMMEKINDYEKEMQEDAEEEMIAVDAVIE